MSRRRFGDADDTYKDFISAIDDHTKQREQRERRRQREGNKQQQQQQQQQIQQPTPNPPPASATSINYQGSTARGPSPLHPYASILNDETGIGTGIGVGSPSLRAAEFGELPIGATEKETSGAFRDFSLRRLSLSGTHTGPSAQGSARRLPLHIGHNQYEEEPLLREEHKTSGGMPADAGGNEHIWLTKRNLDLVIQKKSIWIFLNGLFGIALMCAILQVCWDPTWQLSRYKEDVSVPADYYSDIEWVKHRLSLNPVPLPRSWSWNAVAAECPSPIRSMATEILKLILTISTICLCWQILDRKRLQVSIKLREQRRKLKAKGFNQERDKLYISSLSTASNASTLGLLSLSRSQFRWELWASLIVCIIQPVPFTHQLTGGWIDDKIGILMWMRIFLGLRVVRDCSEIWLNRRSIKHQSSFQTKVPDFSWWLSCKTMSYRSPLTFAGCFYSLCVIIFGHSLYIAERERLPTYFSIWSSVFVSWQIVSVGWPADVWEIYMPITIFGKIVSMFAAMAGLILISFVIVSIGSALHPSRFEENALLYIQMDKVRQKERDGSAALIQYVWKNAQREQELEAKLAPKNPGLYEEISEQEEKQFMENFIQKSKELRTIRRERAELEERSDPTSERNISPMDLYFDTKLSSIQTDIMHQNAKNNQQFTNILATLNQLVHKTLKEKQKQAPNTTTGAPVPGSRKHRASLAGRNEGRGGQGNAPAGSGGPEKKSTDETQGGSQAGEYAAQIGSTTPTLNDDERYRSSSIEPMRSESARDLQEYDVYGSGVSASPQIRQQEEEAADDARYRRDLDEARLQSQLSEDEGQQRSLSPGERR